MPTQVALTLNAVVHSPRGTQNGVSTWMKTGDAAFNGASITVTQSIRGPLDNNRYRAKVLLSAPVLAAENSACACIGSEMGRGKGDFTIDIPTAFTPAQRQDFRKRIKDYFASAEFTALIDNLEGTWG